MSSAIVSTNPSKALRRGLGQGGAAKKLGRVHGGTAAFRSDEAGNGLRLLPQSRPSSNLNLMPRSTRGRELSMHSHGGMYGGGALGSQRCGSRSSTDDVVPAQRAMAMASRTYDKDESRERDGRSGG